MPSTENKGLIFYYYDMLKATFASANYADLVEPGYTKSYKRLIEEVNRTGLKQKYAIFSSETICWKHFFSIHKVQLRISG